MLMLYTQIILSLNCYCITFALWAEVRLVLYKSILSLFIQASFFCGYSYVNMEAKHDLFWVLISLQWISVYHTLVFPVRSSWSKINYVRKTTCGSCMTKNNTYIYMYIYLLRTYFPYKNSGSQLTGNMAVRAEKILSARRTKFLSFS